MAAYYTYNFLPPISSDFDSLLHDFEKESSYTYQSFANIWRQHKLELLFKSADIQPNSFRFFLDDSMTVAAAYLGGSWRLPIQIGALYCLFTVYMYQIEEPKIKVRLPIDAWNSFLDQMESSSDIPLDAKTILCKLLQENAFVTSATRHEMGPRFFTKINYMKSGKYMRSDVLLSSRVNVDEKLVKLCEETHNLYTKAKESLIEAYGGIERLTPEFTSIRPNFLEQLKKGLNLEVTNEEVEEEPEPVLQTQSSVGQNRRRIREKAETIDPSSMGASSRDEFPHDDDEDDEFNDFIYGQKTEIEEDEEEEEEVAPRPKVSKKKRKKNKVN